MVSRSKDAIDFNKLEDEVHAAVDADERYWRENDAKFRAVDQKVANYEEFRDIVLASHIKPLEKEDRIENIEFVQPWNSQASKPSENQDTKSTNVQLTTKLKNIPWNGMEFGRDWRRLCKTNKDKYEFLLKIGGQQLAKIFHAEISFGLLGEFVMALQCEFHAEHRQCIIDILVGLSTTNRFSLSVQFLSSKEKDSMKELYTLCSDGKNNTENRENEMENNLKTIREKYEL